ncbi:MAG: hypothetical protein V3U20_01470 [Thermoplasmata archaeon]
MTKAKVNPHQPWPQPGNADVTPLDNPIPVKVILPVEQRRPGSYKIERKDYPNGVVLVDPAFNTSPENAPVQWTIRATKGNDETLGPGWADGVVVLFHD